MQANGIEAVAIQNWIDQDINRCKGFILLGIPAELVQREDRGTPGIKIGTIIANVRRLEELPADAEETKYERFIGDLVKESDLGSLVGISGGPILGFFDHEGQLHYWVVALQSHSLRNRYIFGCPVKLFGQLILDEIKDL